MLHCHPGQWAVVMCSALQKSAFHTQYQLNNVQGTWTQLEHTADIAKLNKEYEELQLLWTLESVYSCSCLKHITVYIIACCWQQMSDPLTTLIGCYLWRSCTEEAVCVCV